MAVQGAFFWFDYSLKKLLDGTLDLDTQTIKAVLLSNAQAVNRTFLGTSNNAQYSDLTGELATANGYTNGGFTLTGVGINRPSAALSIFKSDPLAWTLTSPITFKYVLLYSFGATNKDLLMVADMDTGGGSVTPAAGLLQMNPDPTNGWGYWSQP